MISAGSARAADAAKASGAEPEAIPELGGLCQWPVNDADPKKSLPTAEQRDRNPLEFGYHID
ncbi:MAG: hypothetical protein WDO74_31755 [Pseudomonadota bacterium]